MRRDIYILLASLLAAAFAMGQARIVFNGNPYIVIDNSAFVVIDNPNANAITGAAAGNIISEAELDRIRWNIGTNTGVYNIPFHNGTSKIPFVMNITGAGVGGTGFFDFSSWQTGAANTPLPSMVPGLGLGPPTWGAAVDVVDRWWIINAQSYTTKPSATLSFDYDAASEADLADNPAMAQADLLAEYYNTAVGLWQAPNFLPLLGIWGVGQVNSVSVTDANFWAPWILVEGLTPLPIELLSFEGECFEDGKVILNWSTGSELNNDHFTLERSVDNVTYEVVGTIAGAGNSNTTIQYSFSDLAPSTGTSYYRLTQTDLDGMFTHSDAIAVSCGTTPINVLIYPNPAKDNLTIGLVGGETRLYSVSILNALGQQWSKRANMMGNQTMDLSGFAIGMYFIRVETSNEVFTKKIEVW